MDHDRATGGSIDMMRLMRWLSPAMTTLATILAGAAHASFHVVQIDQIYSDATGAVQYVRLKALSGGQQFLAGHTIVASSGSSSHSFTFATDLPGDTFDNGTLKSFLVATTGFASLNIVTPDYVVPNGFLFRPGGTINYGESSDTVSYATLPNDGSHALHHAGNTVNAVAQNFAGQTGAVNVPPPVQAGAMDIDQNGTVDALTDGLLLLRYAFGLRGSALVSGAVGPGAARNTAAAIEAYLAACLSKTGVSC
jgi:hypothetical protein